MPAPDLPRVKDAHKDVSRSFGRLQDNVQGLLDRTWSRAPILDGVLVENVVLPGGGEPKAVVHKLGRKARGWILVRKPSSLLGYDVAESDTTNPQPDAQLLLVTTAPGATKATVSLWVF